MTLPSGTVTFMFTDIEGSTRLLHDLGDEYGRLLDRHHSLIREAIDAAGGTEVGTEGDAFFVVFPTAPSAAAAAVAAQRALAAYAWPQGRELRVRMGLHTGEGILMGDNYGGVDVHRAARIASAGHGGQVIMSETTRSLVEASLPDEVRILDLGVHRLKDLERPEHLYQLCIEGLPSEFPPPKSLDSRPNNLPDFLGSFVHRDREVAAVTELLRDVRLVTLTGPGGTGKTRLSLKIASDLLDEFADGVFFVPLSTVTEPDRVPAAIATTLAIKEQGTNPIGETLKVHLVGKEMLLVLDNFEQIITAGGTVSELLSVAPGLKVIVSSRAPLRIYGEQEYPVPPMLVPDPERGPSFEEIAQSEAVELFVQRARSVNPRFALTQENASAVAAICARVDGLPLAVELAASRVRLFSPENLLERLRHSLGVLTGGATDLPARQQTLRGAIQWSYDLLDAPTQTFFVRLGVFVGGWTIDAAESVAAPEDSMDALDELETLLDNNLIRRIEGEGEDRFRMLQTIREFVLEKLEASDDAPACRLRHADYFLQLAETAAGGFTVDETWGDILTAEHDNLRALLHFSLDSGDIGTGLRVGASLWRFWQVRSHLGEGRRWLTTLLDRYPDRDAVRAKALLALGSVTYWQSDMKATARYYGEARDLYRELGDDPGIAEALYNESFVALVEGRYDTARSGYDESHRIYAELGNEKGTADTSWGLAMAAALSDDIEGAREPARRAHDIYTKLGDWYGQALAEYVFTLIARYENDYAEFRRLVIKQVVDAERTLHHAALASLAEQMADAELTFERPRRALRLAGIASGIQKIADQQAPRSLLKLAGDPRELTAGKLEPEEIHALFAEGEAMSWEEAIAYIKKDPEPED